MFAATRGYANPVVANTATYVGGITGTTTISLTGLGLVQNDVVIAVVGRKSAVAPSITTSGYTSAVSASNSGSTTVSMLVAYKAIGAIPDTSFGFSGDVAALHVWRGIDTSSPLASTPTSSGGVYPNSVNSPSINFFGGSVVLSVGLLGHTGGGAIDAVPSGMANYVVINHYSGVNLSAAIASVYSTNGFYDPAAFGTDFGGNETWAAATLALRLA